MDHDDQFQDIIILVVVCSLLYLSSEKVYKLHLVNAVRRFLRIFLRIQTNAVRSTLEASRAPTSVPLCQRRWRRSKLFQFSLFSHFVTIFASGSHPLSPACRFSLTGSVKSGAGGKSCPQTGSAGPEGVKLTLKRPDGSTASTLSDANGKYSFRDLSSGKRPNAHQHLDQ